MTPGSLGPWFATLFCNTAENSKKQTHLIAHTFPHLACDMLNRSGANTQDHWVILLKIGPFESWNIALAFLEAWMSRKRGKQRRLERGIELFSTYRTAYNLRLWSQASTKEEQEQEAKRKRERGEEQQQQQQEEEGGDDPDEQDQEQQQEEEQPAKKGKTEGSSGRTLQDVRAMLTADSLCMQRLVAVCAQDFGMSGLK